MHNTTFIIFDRATLELLSQHENEKKHADDERTGTVENGKEISKFVEHKNYPLRMRERELVQFPSHAPVIKRWSHLQPETPWIYFEFKGICAGDKKTKG